MAIKISGETVVDDSKKGLFNDVVVKGGAGESGEITLNCENNSHGVKLKGPAHSAGADYTLTLPNTSGNSGEVLTTDGTGAMSWEEVVGNEISTTAPTDPSVGALWTDTSEDPAAPILKTWNGSAWVAVGSAAPSEFAPVINNVTLTENDPNTRTMGSVKPILTGQKTKLRPIASSDYQLAYDVFSLDCVTKNLANWPHPLPSEYLQNRIAKSHWKNGWNAGLAIENENGKFIGWIGFNAPSQGMKQDMEIGYGLHPNHWGQGYITEAAELICEYLFQRYPIEKITAYTNLDNLGSQRV